jgi:hypothetical protein
MRLHLFVGLFIMAALAIACLSGTHAQAPQATFSSVPKQHDQTKLTIGQRHFYLSAQRSMEWLQRANKLDGRFQAGIIPALGQRLDGDNYLHQAGAAFALAKAAKFYNNERAAALASQALLTLLMETSLDPKDVRVRGVPVHLANPLAAAGTLLAAIHELPAPAPDLLEQADQLANFLYQQIQADGSLKGASEAEPEAMQNFAGPALYGIIHSQSLRPAPWKLDTLRKGRVYYHAYWQQHKNIPMAVWHGAAYAEAYYLTKEVGFANAVFEINDWLLGLQYGQGEPGRGTWAGGFQSWEDGKASAQAPNIGSAGVLVSLIAGCRLAKEVGDVQHYKRYRIALESGLQFLTTLQYTEANTQHFADWYRPALVGGFHASGLDGNLRLDYSVLSLSALVEYLRYVADLP